MANAYKVLGQVAPAATTDTTLYTVPAATEAVISTIVVANRSATARTYDIAIRPERCNLGKRALHCQDSNRRRF